jgi:hypothetical protein
MDPASQPQKTQQAKQSKWHQSLFFFFFCDRDAGRESLDPRIGDGSSSPLLFISRTFYHRRLLDLIFSKGIRSFAIPNIFISGDD